MDEEVGVGVRVGLGSQLVTVDPGVHVALARPDVDVVAAGLPFDVRAEELVRKEQHIAIGIDRRHHVDSVRRRAADVGETLHLGGRVDVGDDDGVGVLGLPRPEVVGRDRIGERAPRPGIGDQDPLVGAEDLRGLRHEVNAAEHDLVGVDLRRDPGQRKRVTDMVCNILNCR